MIACDSPIFVQVNLGVILHKSYDTKNKTYQTKKIDDPANDADKPAYNRDPTHKLGNKT